MKRECAPLKVSEFWSLVKMSFSHAVECIPADEPAMVKVAPASVRTYRNLSCTSCRTPNAELLLTV